MDIFDRLVSVSKAAAILFNEIKLNVDPKTNIAVMESWKDFDSSQRRANNKKLVELREADMVIKLKQVKGLLLPIEKYSYMINPHLMKPWNYADAKTLWKAVKTSKEGS